jgi:hypothetical protein
MKQNILDLIEYLVGYFVYYDRENLTMEQLNDAVKEGVITVDEMVEHFKKHLEEVFKD